MVWSSRRTTRTSDMARFLPLEQDPSRKAHAGIVQESIVLAPANHIPASLPWPEGCSRSEGTSENFA